MVDQKYTTCYIKSHQITVDKKTLTQYYELQSATVTCGSLRWARGLIIRWSQVQVLLAPILPHILLNGFLRVTQVTLLSLFTHFLRNQRQYTGLNHSNSLLSTPLFMTISPLSWFLAGNRRNRGNKIHYHITIRHLYTYTMFPTSQRQYENIGNFNDV